MPLKEKVPVVVEEHTKCKCDCRIKQKDCKLNQVYIESQCKCECTNVDDHNKCLSVGRFYILYGLMDGIVLSRSDCFITGSLKNLGFRRLYV